MAPNSEDESLEDFILWVESPQVNAKRVRG